MNSTKQKDSKKEKGETKTDSTNLISSFDRFQFAHLIPDCIFTRRGILRFNLHCFVPYF